MVYGANLGVGVTNNDYIVVSKKHSDKDKKYAIPAEKKDSFIKQQKAQEYSDNFQSTITTLGAAGIALAASFLVKGTALKATVGIATAAVLGFAGHQLDKFIAKTVENKGFKSLGAQEITDQA